MLLARAAHAQEPPPPAPPAEPAPTEPPAAPPPVAPQPAEPPAAEPPDGEPPAPSEPPSELTPAPAELAEAPPTEPPPAPPPAPEPMGALPEPAAEPVAPEATTPLTWGLFVDASYSYTSARTITPVAPHRAWETTSFDSANGRLTHNGFNLHWLGLDASYDAEAFAATGSLRFGSAVPVYFGSNRSDLGSENLTQAYVSWRPTAALNLDVGQFNTIYGAEVAESWRNLNYSRGALYYAMQPSHHTGLRAIYAITESVGVTGLLVNGANTLVDDNDKPSLGLQVGIAPSRAFSLSAGYLGALEPSTDADPFSHFFDLVATVRAGDLELVLNGDYNVHVGALPPSGGGSTDASFFGVSASLGYTLSELLGLALRYEHLGDSNNTIYLHAGASEVSLDTFTGTIDVRPVKGSANLIVRWDNRYEIASEEVFFNKDSATTEKWFASILGVVVTTGD